MARPHWETCITHLDEAVQAFVADYFAAKERRCLLIGAAGFDPRSRTITEMLATSLGDRLQALFVREERGKPDANLVDAAGSNQKRLEMLVPNCRVINVDVFGDDDAPVGGSRIAKALSELEIGPEVTDVVLDMTAMSIGIGFPAASLLLDICEARGDLAFHIMIVSNSDLEDNIVSEPGGRAMAVRGFSGPDISSGILAPARIWIPQLTKGRSAALNEIGTSLGECYKICPVLPFPTRDPRRVDALLAEYRASLVDEWQFDPRDIVYVSEQNPLDCYRTLSTLAARYRLAVEGVFAPSIVVSPIGSRVMAVGALMAALEHDFMVQYVETVRYDFDPTDPVDDATTENLVHLLLSGPAYGEGRKSPEC